MALAGKTSLSPSAGAVPPQFAGVVQLASAPAPVQVRDVWPKALAEKPTTTTAARILSPKACAKAPTEAGTLMTVRNDFFIKGESQGIVAVTVLSNGIAGGWESGWCGITESAVH